MAKKAKLTFACNDCGAHSTKWAGQCGECGTWNSIVEVIAAPVTLGDARRGGYAGDAGSRIENLSDVTPEDVLRFDSGLVELDRVLGGGLVSGSVILIGGDPGIGKSTLLLQTSVSLGQRIKTLYVTGEESLQQISMRAHRLNLADNTVRMLSETSVEAILAHTELEKPKVMVVDSIQTVFTESLQSAPGSVAQVRESAARLVRYAKQTGTIMFLVGHVTKDGAIAGPRVLEHMVDTVLYFEGDQNSQFRVIRAIKNRFGAVNELGAFAMTELGLRQVTNPSAIFLSKHKEAVSGSAIMVTREGSRPLLVEVQALVAESHMPNPRRVTVGLDQNRLAMLLAVIHRHGDVVMYDQDVFVNVVGGIRINETAADLAILFAALSSYRNRPLARDLIIFGEIGLAGEVRPVQNGLERLREAEKHGFKKAIIPEANAPKESVGDMEIIKVRRLKEALELL
ncbi:DNA repair protein RadA [hydrothermal vent metagenome]|uniref:DNA repair protein RadA n=1 Tax=hydrothermal vent metagenome TaxID=652676 RepID=A0A3B1A3Z3_9ZZZZ